MELNDILLLLEKFEASDLSSLKVRLKGDEFAASRNGGEEAPSPENTGRKTFPEIHREHASQKPEATKKESPEVQPEEDDSLKKVTSPIVGTFYSRPSEKEEPFVKPGQTVKKGQVLCILEAMKIMNEIKSPSDGIIRKVLLSDGDMADFGKTLFLMEEI